MCFKLNRVFQTIFFPKKFNKKHKIAKGLHFWLKKPIFAEIPDKTTTFQQNKKFLLKIAHYIYIVIISWLAYSV